MENDRINEFVSISRSMLLLRGLILLILGAAIFTAPILAMRWIAILIGVIIIFDGGMLIAAALRSRAAKRPLMIAHAAILITAGLCSLIFPMTANLVWIMLIGIWQIISGVQYLFMRKKSQSRIIAILSMLVSITTGIFFLLVPMVGLLTVSWLIAAVLIIASFNNFIAAWQL